MMKKRTHPKVIVEWLDGLDSEPRIFSLAETYEQAELAETRITVALKSWESEQGSRE